MMHAVVILQINESKYHREPWQFLKAQAATACQCLHTPQVVVVASGTNDWHSASLLYTLDQWIARGVSFLKEVNTLLWHQMSKHTKNLLR